MRTALVLLVVALFASCFAKVRYDNYKVVRLSIQNDTEYQIAFDLASKLNLDIWASNRVESWMDVMLPPSVESLVFPFAHSVRIPNVQTTLDEEEAYRAKISTQKRQDDFFSDFQTSGAIHQFLADQAGNHPGRAVRFSIGQTYFGNEIYALRLGAGAAKPAIVIQCGIHAREWITPSTCCWIIDQLLNHDSDGNDLLTEFEWVIVPSLNVDGYDYTHTNDRLWRKNRQPNTGSFCIGTDLNRNYAYAWGGPGASPSPCSDTFYGSAAFSGPESAAIRDLLQTYDGQSRLVSYWDIHAYGGLWMSPWGYSNNLPSDYTVMDAVMRVATQAIQSVSGRSYIFGSVYRTIYQTSGGSNDWSYGELGTIHSYAVETWGTSFTPPANTIPTIGAEIWAGVKATAQALVKQVKEEQQ